MPGRSDKLKPVRGAVVRLLRDVTTRGRPPRVFRAGLRMTLLGTVERYYLGVKVRGKWFHLQLYKKDAGFYFEVVSVPREDDDEDRPDEGATGEDSGG